MPLRGRNASVRLCQPDNRSFDKYHHSACRTRPGQDIPRSRHSLGHDAGKPQHHHRWRQRFGLLLRAYLHRRICHDAAQRHRMVRRYGQFFSHALGRPASHMAWRPRQSGSRLPLALRQGFRNRQSWLLRRPSLGLRHSSRGDGNAPRRRDAVHISSGRHCPRAD